MIRGKFFSFKFSVFIIHLLPFRKNGNKNLPEGDFILSSGEKQAKL